MDKPYAIIITISQAMLKEKGYKNWLRNFLDAMSKDDWVYHLRLGSQPKHRDLLYVYLNIGNRIRYRANFVETRPEGTFTFNDGRTIAGKAWVIFCGPVVRGGVPMKGFRGFRYSDIIF